MLLIIALLIAAGTVVMVAGSIRLGPVVTAAGQYLLATGLLLVLASSALASPGGEPFPAAAPRVDAYTRTITLAPNSGLHIGRRPYRVEVFTPAGRRLRVAHERYFQRAFRTPSGRTLAGLDAVNNDLYTFGNRWLRIRITRPLHHR